MITVTAPEGTALRVLVVDDDPGIQELLRGFLTAEGYEYRSALRGDLVLATIEESPPDIVLLDVALPGMDGIEICRRLHANPDTAHIPVILMTAHRRREKRLDGISAGARDFLLKPLDLPDLRVRVRNAGEMKRLYDQSQEQLRTITDLESLRDSLVHMVVHDLRSPLTMVMGNLDLMGLLLPEDTEVDVKKALDESQSGARRMTEMISSILDVSKLESGKMEVNLKKRSLLTVAKEAVRLVGPRSSRISISASEDLPGLMTQMDIGLIQRVILNLLSNALDLSPEEEPVVIQVSESDGATRLEVIDRGPGVPEDFKSRIFDKFTQTRDGKNLRKGSVGLGLAFCRLTVEAHGGEIGIDTPEEGGSVFWFQLPNPKPLRVS